MNKWTKQLVWALFLAVAAASSPAGHGACTYLISPTSRTHGYGVATNTVSVSASNTCAWLVENTNDWVFILSEVNGSGTNMVTYSVAANPNPAWRTGVVSIAGQTFTIRQNPVVCSYSLSPTTRTHGYGATTGTVAVATAGGCEWSVSNTNGWITLLPPTSGLGNATITYALEDNLSSLWRTGVVVVADQLYTIVQRSSPCLYELSPSSRVHGHGAVSGLIGVTATAGCGWTAATTNGWISITSGSSGTGDGSVIYSVLANPSGAARTGAVMVADQAFNISQLGAPCAYSITPGSRAHGGEAGSGSVDVTAPLGCAWTVNNPNSWISITADASGSGSGTVNYSVTANPASNSRTGSVLIAGQLFTVTQPGLDCSFKLSPTNRTHGYGTASNTVSINTETGCPWVVVNTNEWLSFSANSGTGSNAVSYTVAANPNSWARSGVVVIAEQVFTISQLAAPCSFSVAPNSALHGSEADTGIVVVSAIAGCVWQVNNTNGWIVITSGTNGTGSGSIVYSVAPNGSVNQRSGVLMVGDEVFSITQSGMVCTYKLSPTNRTHGSGAASNTLSVTTGSACGWSVVNTNPWLAVVSGANGLGSGTISYTVESNPTTSDRTGVVVVEGQTFSVTQRGMGCNTSLSPQSRNHGHGAASNYVTVTTGSNCTWTATTTNSWITIAGAGSGIGNGTAGYLVAANPTIQPRTGAVMIADQVLTLSQNPAPCTYSIVPTTESHGAGMETGSVTVTTLTGCAWSVFNTNGWISILSGSNGVGTGVVIYSVASNPNTNARSATVMIGDDLFTVNQAGVTAACSYRVSPTNRTHGFSATTNSVNLFTDPGCAWSVVNTNPWVTILSEMNGTSSGSVGYAISANTEPTERVGTVMIGGQSFTITQRVVSCSFSISPSTRSHGYGAATNTVTVTTAGGCSWSVVNTNPWVTILSGANGAGNGTVTYFVEINYGLSPRSGIVMIDGQAFSVTQGGFDCMFNVSPANRTHGFAANTGTVSVTTTTNCAWSVSNTNEWIAILSGGSGSGSGSFTYSITGNLFPVQRTGVVMVADQALTLVQRGATNGFSFESIVMQDGARLRLVGAPAGVWRLLGSSNLTDWIEISQITNVSGVVEYTDPGTTTRNMRFYRAVQP